MSSSLASSQVVRESGLASSNFRTLVTAAAAAGQKAGVNSSWSAPALASHCMICAATLWLWLWLWELLVLLLVLLLLLLECGV